MMTPFAVSALILFIGATAITLLMLADERGWRSPLPPLHLDRRWINMIWALLIVSTAISVWRVWGAM
jgi:tryptophan-rich sensory protein